VLLQLSPSLIDPLLTEIHDYQGDLPAQLAYPFCYEPHPIAVWASEQLKHQLQRDDFVELSEGKMFGVLVVRNPQGTLGYLKAFSGTLPGNQHPDGFVPMVYDRFDVDGFFKQGEAELNAINAQVEEWETSPELAQRKAKLKAVEEDGQEKIKQAKQHQKIQKQKRDQQREEIRTILHPEEYLAFDEELKQQGAAIQRQIKAIKIQIQNDLHQAQQAVQELQDRIQQLKDQRKRQSNALQNQLFNQYQFWNIHGGRASLLPLFERTPLQRPPAGAGDCAAPKLFQYAFAQHYHPVALAEFWWGPSPALEIRKHNYFYPACRGKCEPILMGHMLKGLHVAVVGEPHPLESISNNSSNNNETPTELEIVYEDESIVVVNKPPELLSVPGRLVQHSVYSLLKQRYPNATGPLLVHRLDLSTSGILVAAKDSDTHKQIQAQFMQRTVSKRYTSLLERELVGYPAKGKIELPLSTDYYHRPMQKVDWEHGKPATTHYQVVRIDKGRTRIHFYPATGRTHPLRVHAAHPLGLNASIVGDDIYGKRDERLFLPAGFLELTHPGTGKRMSFTVEDPF
jgi:tRNA pseudouridine32 synthase / 23S rRNA pseudouridine746 synthase